MEIFANGAWLPLTFAGLMGLAMLIYAILDGYDLGVGILLADATDEEKDRMIASIGPFWDANETWLVLGVGLLLVAFPAAHGIILTNLYMPVAIMLLGIILRGVSFDFRAKVIADKKHFWNKAFLAGSLITAFSQGVMVGFYILGFQSSLGAIAFSGLVGLCVIAGYCLIGASWLILKTENELQKKAVHWAKIALLGTVIGIALVSLATPLVSPRIFNKWFALPDFFWLVPIPLITGCLVLLLWRMLNSLPCENDKHCWAPLAICAGIFTLCFLGLAYSFYPYIVPEQLTIVDAASAPESLIVILIGALIVLPVLLGYTALSYKIFHGKAKDLTYD